MNLGKKHGTMKVVFEVAEFAYGSFPVAIIASATIKQIKKMLGLVGFYKGNRQKLHEISDFFETAMELRETKVDPAFFKNGIGTELVLIALAFAREEEKLLYLKPERPGEYLVKEERDKVFPMSEERIRRFYLKHGFRDLTRTERSGFSTDILHGRLASELFFGCFNPDTRCFDAEQLCSMPRDGPKAIAIRNIPLIQKVDLLLEFLSLSKKRNRYSWDPKDLARERIESARDSTNGILLARTDFKLPKLKIGPKVVIPERMIKKPKVTYLPHI